MGVEFDDSELRALNADLARVPSRALPKVEKVVRKSTADVVRGGKRGAPVDTGNLRSSISGTVQGLTGEAGPTADYGDYVERGTSRMAPQPYMGPALDAVEPSFLAAVAAVGEEALGG